MASVKKVTLEQYKARVKKRLSELMPFLQKVAMGDFSKSIKLPDEEDEFTELSVSINLMIEDLREMKEELEYKNITLQSAKKDLELENKKNVDRFELAMKGSNDGLWDWNMKTNKVYFSSRWKSMLGYEDSEIGESFDEFAKRIHSDDAKRVSDYVNNYVQSLGKNNFELEFRMKHKKGYFVDILARAFLKKDKQGKPERLVGTHIDLTERKLAEEKSNARATELESLNKFMIGRELKMLELKKEIENLKNKS